MNEITNIKNEDELKQWVEMIRQLNESGLTVAERCTLFLCLKPEYTDNAPQQ